MSISKDSICLHCTHCRTVTTDYVGANRTIVLVECDQEVCRFPIQDNSSCPCFKSTKGENNENR